MTEAAKEAIEAMANRFMEEWKSTNPAAFTGDDWFRYAMDEDGKLTITRVLPGEIYLASAPPYKPSQE